MSSNRFRSVDASPVGPNQWNVDPLTHLVRYMTMWIKGLYAQLPAGAYRWDPATENSPDQGGSEIFITTETPVKTKEYVGSRPAIAILRGPAAGQGIGLGDNAFQDWATGQYSKMDVFPTTLFINILSRIPLESSTLCWFTGSHIWALRDTIIKGQSGILYLGNRPNYAPTSPAGSLVAPDTEHNWVTTTVSFPVYLQHAMHVQPLHSGPGTGIVQGIETVMTALRDSSSPSPAPTLPLQGSVVQQAKINPGFTATQPSGSGLTLPPDPEPEAQSTDEPLSVRVKT